MTRTSRAIALAGVGALVLTLVPPGVASASGPSVARRAAGVGVQVENEVFAGYVSQITGRKSIVGTYRIPQLGDCSDGDEGIFSAIELATTGGAEWVDGAVFSYCSGGTKVHNAVFDTTTVEGQVPIDEVVRSGDKIKVTSVFRRGKTKVTMENLTRGWTVTDSFESFVPEEASSLYYTMTAAGVPLPPLSSDQVVKGVKISGDNLAQTNPTKVVLVDANGDPIVRPTAITGGTDFKFDYVG